MSAEKNKSIALVANSCWYLYNLRLGVIKALQKANFTVTVIAPRDEYSARLVRENCLFIPVDLNCKGINPFEDARYCLRLMRLYRRRRFQHVFHYTIKPNIYGSIAAAFQKTASTAVISGLGYPFIRKGLFYYLVRFLYAVANRLANEVWFVNPDDKKQFEDRGIVAARKARLLPGEGVDLDHFTRTKPVAPSDGQPAHFLFSGRLIWSKGVGEYVKAARIIKKKYPDTVFSILGYLNVNNPDAIPPENMDAWRQEGVIRYLGFTDDVRPYLESASCLVLPTYYGEGVPRSLLEAASMEVPIIATDQVGCREVVKDGFNGFLCRKKSASDLAQKMETFLRLDSEGRRGLGKNGRKLAADRFDESFVIGHYLQKLGQARDIRLQSPAYEKR